MRQDEGIVKLKMFQLQEKRRQFDQLAMMIGEFCRMRDELDAQIAAEEHKWGVHDPNHFTYPPLARAARMRRENLHQSTQELQLRQQQISSEIEEETREIDQTCIRHSYKDQTEERNFKKFQQVKKNLSQMALAGGRR